MNRFLKWVLVLAGLVVVVLAVATVILPRMYDSEDLKIAIAGSVAGQTGRELRIDGALEFSVFPVLAIEVNDLTLGNAEGFGDQPFARIGQARVGIALLPLLRKQLLADEVLLTGLQVNLMVNERGADNWGELASGGAGQSPQGAGQEHPFASQRVAGVNITDASIDYRDLQAGTHYRLGNFSLRTGALGEASPVPVSLSMLLEDVVQATQLEIELATVLSMDVNAGVHTLADFELRARGGDPGVAPVTLTSPALVLDTSRDMLEAGSFSLGMGGLAAEGRLEASAISSAPRFAGSLEASAFSPRELMQSLGLQPLATADPSVMQSMDISMDFSGDASALSMSNVKARLDDSRISGELGISNLAGEVPALRFVLDVDRIDADRYMAPAEPAAGGGEAEIAIPKDELAGVDLDGTLRVASLTAMGMTLNDAEIGLRVHNGVLRLHPLTAGIYGGRYQGDITLDSSGAVPSVSLNENIQSVVFQQLATDLLGSDQVSGAAKGQLRVTGVGATGSAMIGSLEGTLDLQLDEGALEGVDVWHQIRKGMATLKGQPEPEGDAGRTVFSRMNMQGTIEQGVLSLDELLGELPFLSLQGQGEVDLRQMVLDVGLVAAVRSSPELSADPLAAQLSGKKIPFRISGPASEPRVSVDLQNLLKSEATDRLMDKLGLSGGDEDGEQDGDSNSLEKKAKGILGGLLGGRKKDDDRDEGDGGG